MIITLVQAHWGDRMVGADISSGHILVGAHVLKASEKEIEKDIIAFVEKLLESNYEWRELGVGMYDFVKGPNGKVEPALIYGMTLPYSKLEQDSDWRVRQPPVWKVIFRHSDL